MAAGSNNPPLCFLRKFCWPEALRARIYGKRGELLLLERKKETLSSFPVLPLLGLLRLVPSCPGTLFPAVARCDAAGTAWGAASSPRRSRDSDAPISSATSSLLSIARFGAAKLRMQRRRRAARVCRGKGGDGRVCTVAKRFPRSWGWDLHPCSFSAAPSPGRIARSQRNTSLGLFSSPRPNAPGPEDTIKLSDSAHCF